MKEKAGFLSATQAYLDKGFYQEALDLAEDWLKRYPGDAEANIVCCHAWMRMGKLDRVDELLNGVQATILKLSRIYSFMGDICLESGLSLEAIRFFRKFLSINPESNEADAVSKKLRFLTSEAAETPLLSVDDEPEESDDEIGDVASDFHTITLADLYVKQGHLQMAVDVLREILRKDADNHQAADRLQEVMAMMETGKRSEGMIQELTRWLQNIHRMGCHAT